MSPSEDRRTEIALFRYTLILPLLRREHPPGGKHRLREQIASRHYDIPYASRSTISPATLARWERRYRQAGFEGLKPQPRSDRGTPRTISPATLDRAETLKREQPLRSTRSIIEILTRDQTNPIPEPHLAPRTLRRHLAARDATTPQLLHQQRPKPYRRFQRSHFGDLWQGDAMHGPYLPDPAHPDKQRQVFLFAFIDDHTRLVPHAQFYWNEQLPRMEDCLKRAIRRHGRPLAIYVDRAKIHLSQHLDTLCATLGMQRILGTPYYPEGRGKIERLFEFIQSDFVPELSTASLTTLQQLNVSLLAWLEVIYGPVACERSTRKPDRLPWNGPVRIPPPPPAPSTPSTFARPSSTAPTARSPRRLPSPSPAIATPFRPICAASALRYATIPSTLPVWRSGTATPSCNSPSRRPSSPPTTPMSTRTRCPNPLRVPTSTTWPCCALSTNG